MQAEWSPSVCEREAVYVPQQIFGNKVSGKLAAASTWAGVDLAELGTVVGGGK